MTNIVRLMDPEKQTQRIKESKYDCFLQMYNARKSSNPDYCNHTWDGIMCWEEAPPGTRQRKHCPDYIHGFNTYEYATRDCTSNGTWYSPPSLDEGNGWTNYLACMAHRNSTTTPPSLQAAISHAERLKLIEAIGYGISLVALVLAVFIMCCSRRLKSKSNTLHANLFIAFIMRACLSFIIRRVFVDDLGLEKDFNRTQDGRLVFIEDITHWECRSLVSLFMYTICASQIWIFMEGLYLFMLIYKTMLTERSGVKLYIILGWALPIFIIVPWTLVKMYKDNQYCWTYSSKPEYIWIIHGPLLTTVVLNFIFFVNICHVLCSRVRSSQRHMGRANRSLAKFILVLIPLFGLFYIVLTIAFPTSYAERFDLVHMYVEMTYNSFQGFLLALLFCFLNEEVHSEIKRIWWIRARRRDSVATRSFVLSSFKRNSRQSRAPSHSGFSQPLRSSDRFSRSDSEEPEGTGCFLRLKRRVLAVFGVQPPYPLKSSTLVTAPEGLRDDGLESMDFPIMDDDNMKCHMKSVSSVGDEESCSG